MINEEFFIKVSALLENSKKNLVYTINTAMVYTYFEIGKMIVEEEQQGKERAEYGKKLIKELSDYLSSKFGKGYSSENLKLMRRFYKIYNNVQIGETVFTQFEKYPITSSGRRFYLSWSHYLMLMRITNKDERHFYEIESVKNNWSLSELKRQFDTSLFERLVLSKDKSSIKELASQGQIITTSKDLVKDPYILEFLGLPEQTSYSESELETKIIDNLQKFLLELGTGFAFVG